MNIMKLNETVGYFTFKHGIMRLNDFYKLTFKQIKQFTLQTGRYSDRKKAKCREMEREKRASSGGQRAYFKFRELNYTN